MKKIYTVAVLMFCAVFIFAQNPKNVKNIILVIGDGFGPQEVGLMAQYARYAPSSPYADRQSNLEKFFNKSNVGLALTNPKHFLVTDSACSGTQIATGHFSSPESVGVDYQGNAQKTILEYAKEAGKSTGLITTVYLQDATPAVFAAHQLNRNKKAEIASDMVNTGVDVMLGGGRKYFAPIAGQIESLGYKIINSRVELENIELEKGKKLLGVFAENEIPFVIMNDISAPSLIQMTEKALDILSQNEKGFFIMVEAGRIDWALHANDAASSLHEILELDETLGYLLKWAEKRNDTLVILTADHETGGFGFNYHKLKGERLTKAKESGEVLYGSGTDYVSPEVFEKIMKQKTLLYNVEKEFNALPKRKQKSKTLGKMLSDAVGYQLSGEIYKDCKTFSCALKNYNNSLGIVWSTGAHTATPVEVAAWGPTQANYSGLYHTTDLNKKMRKSFGFEVK